jgi:hypothetical protein
MAKKTSRLSTLRNPKEIFTSPSRIGGTLVVLVTHLHVDHADPGTIARALSHGGSVFRPPFAAGWEEDLK